MIRSGTVNPGFAGTARRARDVRGTPGWGSAGRRKPAPVSRRVRSSMVGEEVSQRLDPAPLDTFRTRRVLLAMVVAAIVLFVVLYAFAVHTHWGQRLDAAALEGRGLLSRHDVHVAARLHNWIDVASLTLLGGA